MFITLEPHGIFGSEFACVCMSLLSNRWHVTTFLIDKALLSNSSAGRGQLAFVKMLIQLSLNRIVQHVYLDQILHT